MKTYDDRKTFKIKKKNPYQQFNFESADRAKLIDQIDRDLTEYQRQTN